MSRFWKFLASLWSWVGWASVRVVMGEEGATSSSTNNWWRQTLTIFRDYFPLELSAMASGRFLPLTRWKCMHVNFPCTVGAVLELLASKVLATVSVHFPTQSVIILHHWQFSIVIFNVPWEKCNLSMLIQLVVFSTSIFRGVSFSACIGKYTMCTIQYIFLSFSLIIHNEMPDGTHQSLFIMSVVTF